MGTDITFITDTATVVITGDRPFEGCTYDKFEGWYGIDPVDLAFVKRPGAPGAFAPTQTNPPEKAISIEGDYFGADRHSSLIMRETLASLYNNGRPVMMYVQDDLRLTWREVMVESVDIPWTIHPDFTYSIDVKAPDPRRYGATVVAGPTGLASAGSGLVLPFDEATGVGLMLPSDEATGLGLDLGSLGTAGRLLVENEGNADTETVFTVAGGSMPDGFVVVNVATGQRLTYLGPVTDGAIITLDGATRTAFINDTAPAGRWLSNPEWWSVGPGVSFEVAFLSLGAVTGTPQLTAATPPGFY